MTSLLSTVTVKLIHILCTRLPRWLSGKGIRQPMQETQESRVRSLGQKDPLKQEIVTHANIPAWRIPWTEEPGRLQSMGSQNMT